LREEFKVSVTFQQLVDEFYTIESLANYIDIQLEVVLNTIKKNEEEIKQNKNNFMNNNLAPTDIQQYFLNKAHQEANILVNINSSTIKIAGEIDIDKLKQSALILSERHHALKMRYDSVQRKFVYDNTMPTAVFDSNYDSFSNLNLEELIKKEKFINFDENAIALFRTNIVKINANKASIILSADYSICDEWSMDTMIKEYLYIYAKLLNKENIALSEAYQFSSYLSAYAGIQHVSSLGEDITRDLVEDYQRHQLVIIEKDYKTIKSWCANKKVSLFSFVLSSISYLLKLFDGLENITIPVAGQAILNHPDLVGQCSYRFSLSLSNIFSRSFESYVYIIQDALVKQYNSYILSAESTESISYKRLEPKRSKLMFTHIQRLSKSDLNHKQFSADYILNGSSSRDFEMEYRLIEYDNKFIVECDYQKDKPVKQLMDKFVSFMLEKAKCKTQEKEGVK
jgi:hypothetical protein